MLIVHRRGAAVHRENRKLTPRSSGQSESRGEGPPGVVITAELVEKVFGLSCVVVPDPVAGTPIVVPA